MLNDKIDFNERSVYQIILFATDGHFNTTTDLDIFVKDVQDSPPIFESLTSTIISENSSIGTLVMTVKAKDSDKGEPREIVYDLVTNFMDYFSLDSKTGALHTARPLDREKILDDSGTVQITVRASEIEKGIALNDSSASSTVNITITVTDVNDTPPTFEKKEYVVSVSEDTPNGTLLPVEINIADADMGNNSIFSLRLDDLSEVFDIEPKLVTGSSHVNIRVSNGTLDFENINHRKFIVLLIAEEKFTTPKLSSTATLQVNVLDINDNRPIFLKESYYAEIIETAPPGEAILTVTAKDLDSGVFGDDGIRYSLHGAGAHLFDINKNTGLITVAKCDANEKRRKRDFKGKEESLAEETSTTILLSKATENQKYESLYGDNKDKITNLFENSYLKQSIASTPQFGMHPCLDFESQNVYFLSVTVSRHTIFCIESVSKKLPSPLIFFSCTIHSGNFFDSI